MFHRISMTNDWGSRKYFAGSLQIKASLGQVLVKWSSGGIELLPLEIRKEGYLVSDHGKEHDVESDVPYVYIIYNGLKFTCPLYGPNILVSDERDE